MRTMIKRVPIWMTAGLALLALPLSSSTPGDGRAAGSDPGERRAAGFGHQGGKFLPGADEDVRLFQNAPEFRDRYSEASVIKMAYAALAEAISTSGHFVSFSLQDFRTYYRRDFEEMLVRELITLDYPFRLEVRQTEVGGADGGTVGYSFTPRWVQRFTLEDAADMKEFMDQFREFTIADGLRHPEAKQSQQRMIAVTSYEVTAKYEGESHTYRAAFKWIPGSSGEVTFEVEDYVTDGVDRALITEGQIAPLEVLLGRSFDHGVEEGEEQR